MTVSEEASGASPRTAAPALLAAFALGFSFAWLAFLARLLPGPTYWDEGTILYDSVRVLQGQVIYRDFFEFLAPLTFYLQAAAFSVFGTSLLTARLLTAGFVGVTTAGLYACGRQLAPVSAVPAWIAPVAYAAFTFQVWPVASHHHYAMTFVVIALLAAMSSAWVTAGLLAALAGLTLQSEGGPLLVGLLLAALLLAEEPRSAAKRFLLGAGGPLLVTAGALLAAGAFDDAFRDAFLFLFRGYRPGNEGSIGGGVLEAAVIQEAPLRTWLREVFQIWGLPALLLVWLGSLTVRRFSARVAAPDPREWIAAVGAACVHLPVLLYNVDRTHIALTGVPVLLALPAFTGRLARRLPEGGRARLMRALAGVLIVAAAAKGAGLLTTTHARGWGLGDLLRIDEIKQDDDLLQRVIALAGEDGTVLAPIYGGFLHFYGPPPATRYTHVFPTELGYHTSEQWEEIEKTLRTTPPEVFVGQLRKLPEEIRSFLEADYRLVHRDEQEVVVLVHDPPSEATPRDDPASKLVPE